MSWPAWVLADTSTPDKGKVRRCAGGSAGLIAPGVGPPLIGPPWVGYRRPDDDEDGVGGLPSAGGGCDDVVSRPRTNTGSGWKVRYLYAASWANTPAGANLRRFAPDATHASINLISNSNE